MLILSQACEAIAPVQYEGGQRLNNT